MSHESHRQRIASVVSSLRPVRPRVPFYRLSAHSVPTLWVLYRGLLRASPNSNIRAHIQDLFRRHRHLTSPVLTKVQLEKGHRWLDAFNQAQKGDERLRAVLERFGRLIDARRNNLRMKRIVDDSLAWQHRLINRPIVTGALFKPSIHNGPLPRLKPQPDHISGMIHKRRVARAKRIERQHALFSQLEDLRIEAQFEDKLAEIGAPIVRSFSDPHRAEWKSPLDASLEKLAAAFDRDAARAARPTPPELVRQLKAARREKVANKTREREREARGEVLTATRLRSRVSFPAHVLARWSPEERKANLLARRSVGEVGYVGQVKRALGYKIPPEEDRVDEATREMLDALTDGLRRVNQSRRAKELGMQAQRTARDCSRRPKDAASG
ncbi:hypothetical protein EDB89DRAFT_1852620 [Lactarius sanguifluus]|nr:hypothetical protein EDB89DRAFT_1852620 [Lactarius sanguifluus]